MGHIGCGNPMNGRGRDIANQALNTIAIRYVAICDVDRVNREAFADTVLTQRQTRARLPSSTISASCWPAATSTR